MMMKTSSKGISLISLIITIIVIIILAAIVIFSGMGTPEKAQLSAVISDIDNVQTAVDKRIMDFILKSLLLVRFGVRVNFMRL